MKKRTFCMLILALVLISLFAIGASADYYSNPIAVTYTMPTAGTSTEGFQDNFVLAEGNSGIEIRTVYITDKDWKIVPTFVAGEEYICWVSFSGKNDSFAFSKGQNEQEYKAKVSVNGEDYSAVLIPEDLGLLSKNVAIPKWNPYDLLDAISAPFLYIKFSVIPKSSPINRFKEVNISIAEDLAMTFYYTPEENEPYTDYRTQATLQLAGGGMVSAELSPRDKDGKKAFTFTGIAPQCMCDELTQILQGKKEDGTWEDIAQMTCSIREYCIRLLEENDSNEPLKKLIYDLLAYGSAAQSYRYYNTGNLSDAGYSKDGLRSTFPKNEHSTGETEIDVIVSEQANYGNGQEGKRFRGAKLLLNNVNYISFSLEISDPENSKGLWVSLDYGGEDNSDTVSFSQMERGEDGFYHCYSRPMSLCSSGDPVNATLYDGQTKLQRVEYSVNHYVARMYNSGNSAHDNLVKRLYCLGKSAKAYGNSN